MKQSQKNCRSFTYSNIGLHSLKQTQPTQRNSCLHIIAVQICWTPHSSALSQHVCVPGSGESLVTNRLLRIRYEQVGLGSLRRSHNINHVGSNKFFSLHNLLVIKMRVSLLVNKLKTAFSLDKSASQYSQVARKLPLRLALVSVRTKVPSQNQFSWQKCKQRAVARLY